MKTKLEKRQLNEIFFQCPPYISLFPLAPDFHPPEEEGRVEVEGEIGKGCQKLHGYKGGGGRETWVCVCVWGGLCCCNVVESVCQRHTHHKISQSVCQSVCQGVAPACTSVFMTLSMFACLCGLCVCGTANSIQSERGEKMRPHPLKIHQSHNCGAKTVSISTFLKFKTSSQVE